MAMRRIPALCIRLGLAGFLVCAPVSASADVLLSGFVGSTRLDETNKTTYGGALGFGGLIGLEFEAARIQLGSFDEIPGVDVSAHATTLMGNFVVRFPAGPVQPYGTAGVGLMRITGDVDVVLAGDVISASAQDFAWNIGGGLFIFPTPNFGIRGDIRHFRTGDVILDDIPGIGGLDDLPLPDFDFWRYTAGVTLKF
jgi:opacity protein-like surface antigen